MARVFTHSTSVLLAALTLGLTGCGGGDASSSSAPAPSTTATAGPTATSTATPSPTPATATAPSAPSPPPDAPTPPPTATGESQPGGGGDEAAARVPVAVTVGSDGSVSPRQVDVPSFLALELRVHNRTGGPLNVRWTASEPSGEFTVPGGGTVTRQVAGVKRGLYRIEVESVGVVTVMSGSQPGP
jgi:hypothetical protein